MLFIKKIIRKFRKKRNKEEIISDLELVKIYVIKKIPPSKDCDAIVGILTKVINELSEDK